MIVNFDFFNRPERPELILSNPNKSYISALGNAYNIKLDLKFNDISELNFEIPYKVDNTVTPYYDQIIGKKLILFKDVAWFKIQEVNTVSDGLKETKQVKAYSLEVELAQKKITTFSGTYKFYDPVSPSGTLMYEIISMLKGWTLGYIDSTLRDKTRTFSVSDQNLFNFLMSSVEQSYECFFTFNTFEKKINAYSVSNYVNNTSIYLSFDNLLKQTEVTEISSEIITKLGIYGGNGLDVHQTNPLGDNYVYNFSHYKNTNWMEQSLIDAITTWENKITTNKSTYSSKLVSLKGKYNTLLTKQTELTDLQSALTALEGTKKAKIEQGLSLTDINSQISSKQSEITTKNNEITQVKNEITVLNNDLVAINNLLKIENNFTSEQLTVLDSFIFEETYQNDSFITVSTQTLAAQLTQAEQLYDQGVRVLTKISQPKYQFKVQSVNFLHSKEFSDFHSLNLGSILKVELKEGVMSYPICLQISIDYENDDFNLIFGNRYRLDSSEFVFSDLFEDAFKAGSSVSFDKYLYTDWTKNAKDDVTSFITSALDCTTNYLKNNSNQEITITTNGLRGKQFDPNTGGYATNECWLTSSTLAFSNDNFSTSKLALGKIIDPAGSSVYGLVADVIVGRMVASNSLLITNSNNKFSVDAAGCTLTDAKFTLTSTNNKGKIILDPTSTIPIRVQGNTGGTFVDKFYVDSSGNVKFSGELSGATGSFSGSLSAATGTFSGGLSGATGTFSGSLSAATGTFSGQLSAATGTFSGTVQAGSIISSTINNGNGTFSVNSAGTVTASNINITGGNISISNNATIGNYLYIGNQSSLLEKGITFYNGNNTTGINLIDNGDFRVESDKNLALIAYDGLVQMSTVGTNGNIYIRASQNIELEASGYHCDIKADKINLYGEVAFDNNKIGFFGENPVIQQEASLLGDKFTTETADLTYGSIEVSMLTHLKSDVGNLYNKVNGILTKLSYYGLFDIVDE